MYRIQCRKLSAERLAQRKDLQAVLVSEWHCSTSLLATQAASQHVAHACVCSAATDTWDNRHMLKNIVQNCHHMVCAWRLLRTILPIML